MAPKNHDCIQKERIAKLEENAANRETQNGKQDNNITRIHTRLDDLYQQQNRNLLAIIAAITAMVILINIF